MGITAVRDRAQFHCRLLANVILQIPVNPSEPTTMNTQSFTETPEYLEELQTRAASQESCRRVFLVHAAEVITSLPDPEQFLKDLQERVNKILETRSCICFDGKPGVYHP